MLRCVLYFFMEAADKEFKYKKEVSWNEIRKDKEAF